MTLRESLVDTTELYNDVVNSNKQLEKQNKQLNNEIKLLNKNNLLKHNELDKIAGDFKELKSNYEDIQNELQTYKANANIAEYYKTQ